MTSDNDAPAVPVRVDAYDADWMIVTVDGVRLTAAPVRRVELEQTLEELAARMGRPAIVEVREHDGTARRGLLIPDATAVPDSAAQTDGTAQTGRSTPGRATRARAGTRWLLWAAGAGLLGVVVLAWLITVAVAS